MDIEREGLPISVTLIKPSGVHTPFPEHGRNHMEAPPRIPQIIYAPQLVADAILFAAEHSRRQIYVGGFGFMLSLLGRMFPRMTDRVMEAALVGMQQSTEEPGDPAARDNLYRPRSDGRAEGTQRFAVKRFSLFLEAQKHPLAATALGAGVATAAAWAARQRGVSVRRRAAYASGPGPSAHNGDRARPAREAVQ